MGLLESIFDSLYLAGVILLGIHLLLQKNASARLFGAMGVILGLGDAFHLLPRIMAHMSENGFARFLFLLSWGRFVTSVTMTVFYLLFYFYYKKRTGKNSRPMDWFIYACFVLRVALLLLPQNNWGKENESLLFGLLRNIPFSIMGFSLVFFCLQEKKDPLLKKMGILICLSFLFYIPVVLFSSAYPWTGAFMLPKTLAYFLLVYTGFKAHGGAFSKMRLLYGAFSYLVFELLGGVFYREFTKAFAFEGVTRLSLLHVHLLVLGFIVSIAFFLLLSRISEEEHPACRRPLLLWNAGLLLTITQLFLRGVHDVVGGGYPAFREGAFSGIAGIGHILLGTGLVWLFLLYLRSEEKSQKSAGSLR